MIYTSIENEKIKEIKKLHKAKYRTLTNLFLVEGEHLVFEAYKKGYIKELILEEGKEIPFEIETLIVSKEIIKYLSELETPQGIMAICHKKEDSNNLGKRILMLDGVQDPGNLGAIIRSALAFNIDTIVLSDDTVDLYNSKVIRASQGMMFHINIISDCLVELINKLKSKDYKIYGTKVDGGKSLKKIVKVEKFAIIVGNEGNGVSEACLSLCDEFIYIDTNKNCESLNVGVAASIILYELDK